MKKALALVAVLSFLFPFAAFADSSVTATAGTGATVTPSGVTVVPTGVDQTFSIGAADGYHLTGVVFDGIDQGVVGSVDFTGIAADVVDHTLFAAASINAPTGGSQPFCSSPSAPGWRVGLIGGGCGGSQVFLQPGQSYGSFVCPDAFVAGCVLK